MTLSKPLTTAGVAVLAAAVAVGLYLFFQNDEAKIKKCFRALEGQIEKTGEEHDIIAAAKARKIESFFGPTVSVDIASYDIRRDFQKNDISANALYARSRYHEIDMEFKDIRILLTGENTARAALTAVLKTVMKEGSRVAESHAIEWELEKIEGEWLLTGVRELEIRAD